MKQFFIVIFVSFTCFTFLFSEGKVQSNSSLPKKDKIVLYIKPTCPYCRKVITTLEQLNKKVEIRDISQDDRLRDELVSIGGKKQVPCIVINGKAKYESADIIEWLIHNKDLY